MSDRTKPGRLVGVVVLLAAVVALCVIPTARAGPPSKRLTADELRYYLLGFVDAVTGPDWAAVGARCSLQGGLFACSVRAANSSSGKSRCWYSLISRQGVPTTPLTRTRCALPPSGKQPPGN